MKKLPLLLALFFLLTAARAETPYGCYKELRWGMNPEEALKTLAATEPKEFRKDDILLLTLPSFVPAGEEKLYLIMEFRSDKLDSVEITFGGLDDSCLLGARKRISAFKLFREALSEKYGKPLKEVDENRSRSPKMEEAICQEAGMMEAEWETGESKIMLLAELAIQDVDVAFFKPLLIYIDKTQLPKETKPDL